MRQSAWIGFVGATLVAGLLGACGGKKPAPVATVATVATTPAAADATVAAAPDTTAAAPDTTPEPADTAAPSAPEATDDAAASAEVAGEVAAADDAVAPSADGASGDAAAAEEVAAGDTTTTAEKPFAELSEQEKKDFMKKIVLPKARDMFQTFDAKKYEKFGCQTCHGPDAKETKFKMPNPKLPKLPSTADGWKKLGEKKQPALDFMKELSHTMAAFVHEAPFDPKTGKGFGCFECHTKE